MLQPFVNLAVLFHGKSARMWLRNWNGANNARVQHVVYTLSCWLTLQWCTGACNGVHLLRWVFVHVDGAICLCYNCGAL